MGGNTIALWNKAHRVFMKMSNNRYMQRSPRRHHGRLPSGWNAEEFRVVNAPHGRIALWNPSQKRFVRMPSGRLMDRSPKRHHGRLPHNWNWEQFKVVIVKKAGTHKGTCRDE